MPLNKGILPFVYSLYTTCIYVEYKLYLMRIQTVYHVNTSIRQLKIDS